MPTLPPEPAALSRLQPHQYRGMAESFGVDPSRYDRARPRYPDALVAAVVAAGSGTDLLDVGCGTGISARQFSAAGCRVLGVEVDGRMAEYARRGGLEVEVSAFEAWEPAGREFDAVIAGQAWHWVDPVAGAAKAAGVLRPGGVLAVFWNVMQPSPEVAEAFASAHRRAQPDLPRNPWTSPVLEAYSAILTKAADGIRRTGAFGEARQRRFEWACSYTREQWLDQLPTFGGHGQLPPATRSQLLAGMGDAVDAVGGSFTMRYIAVMVTAVRA